MTVVIIIVGLLPIMWSTGAGADVMKRIAAPMVGGVITSAGHHGCRVPVIYLPLARSGSINRWNRRLKTTSIKAGSHAILIMADSLNLGVIAEGVEKRSQLDSCEEGSAHERLYAC